MVHVCLRRCEPSTTLIVAAFVGCVNDGESIYWAERKYANEVKETLRCPIWAFAKTMHLPQYWVHPLRRGHGGIPKWQLGQGFSYFKHASRSLKILFGHLLFPLKVGMKQYATNILVETFLEILESNRLFFYIW